MKSTEFVDLVVQNPINAEILKRWDQIALPDCWLVAGCLFQTVWNLTTGHSPTDGIKDYDIFYFDDSDLSYQAEDREIQRITSLFSYLGANLEIRNQARVHLWYENRFGPGYPQLKLSRDGIDRFLVETTCIAIRINNGAIDIYAPHGLDDLEIGVLRPNRQNLRPALFQAKAASYCERWPWLKIQP